MTLRPGPRAASLLLSLAALPISASLPSAAATPSPAAPDAQAWVELSKWIVERHEPREKATWYEPILDYSVPHDFSAYPVIRKDDRHGTTLLLRAVRRSEREVGLEGLEVVLQGAATSIPIGSRDLDVDRHGCRVAETVTVAGREPLIRRIASAHEAEFIVHGTKDVYRFPLPAEDLEKFRRVVAYYDRLISPRPAPAPGSALAPGSASAPGPTSAAEPRPAPGPGVTEPELISRVEPIFPKQAREKKKTGRVTLQAVIRKDGTVGDLKVLRSTACDCGFEDAAMAAVTEWRYKPAVMNGEPVDVYFTVEVDFKRK